MNIAIIGGSGFLGNQLANYFGEKSNNYIVTISRSEPIATKLKSHHLNVSAIGWKKIIEELSVFNNWIIIDLAYASVPNSSYTDPVKDFSDNLYLVNKHLENIRNLDVLKYIYVSSGGTIYGDCPTSPIDERAPNFPLSPYGITKMACERYVHMHHVLEGLRTNIVRPANIYGPGQIPFRGQGLIATLFGLIYQNRALPVFGDGSVVRDYLYKDDFCTAISDIIEYGKNGEIYNIGSGAGHSIADVINEMKLLLGKEDKHIIIENQPARPFDVQSNILNPGKLQSLNGWRAKTPLDIGIKKSWEWIKTYMEENSTLQT